MSEASELRDRLRALLSYPGGGVHLVADRLGEGQLACDPSVAAVGGPALRVEDVEVDVRPAAVVRPGEDAGEAQHALGVGHLHAAQVVLVAEAGRVHRVPADAVAVPEVDRRAGVLRGRQVRLPSVGVDDGQLDGETHPVGGRRSGSEAAADVTADDAGLAESVGPVGAVARVRTGRLLRNSSDRSDARRRSKLRRRRRWRRSMRPSSPSRRTRSGCPTSGCRRPGRLPHHRRPGGRALGGGRYLAFGSRSWHQLRPQSAEFAWSLLGFQRRAWASRRWATASVTLSPVGMWRNSFGPWALLPGPRTPVMTNWASGRERPSIPMNGIVPPSPT